MKTIRAIATPAPQETLDTGSLSKTNLIQETTPGVHALTPDALETAATQLQGTVIRTWQDHSSNPGGAFAEVEVPMPGHPRR